MDEIKLISVSELVKRLNNRFTIDNLKALRSRHKLFIPAIRLGKSTAGGGVDGYVPEKESIEYLKEVIRMHDEFGHPYSHISEMVEDRTRDLKLKRDLAKNQQESLNDPNLSRGKQSIEIVDKYASELGLKRLFAKSPIEGYELIKIKYRKTGDPFTKERYKALLDLFAEQIKLIIRFKGVK